MIRRGNSVVTVGAVAAFLLLLAGGTAYRLLAARYDRPTNSIPLKPGSLAALPMIIGEWVGRDDPLDEAVVRATGTDDHINRTYTQAEAGVPVALFIAYGVRLRDLEPHRPEVCYPGAGWTLDEVETLTLSLGKENNLPCRILRFDRGGFAPDRITVLNYYIVDGEYAPDVSLLRSKAWRFRDDASYAAQVQVVCGGSLKSKKADQWVRAFAVESAPAIRSLLVSAVKEALSASEKIDDPK